MENHDISYVQTKNMGTTTEFYIPLLFQTQIWSAWYDAV